MTRERSSGRAGRPRPPIDADRLEALALRYVERYATSRGRLADYLRRKLAERGWDGAGAPPIEALTERLAGLGYVDDRAFAESRAASLSRRGYGGRRVRAALDAARIAPADRADACRTAEETARAAALTFARRKRIGPYAAEPADRAGRERAIAAMIRAGHDFGIAREIASATPDDLAELEADPSR